MAQGYTPLRLAYLVSRFPKTTETFVVRELNEIAANPDIQASLYSLFPPLHNAAAVHPSARAWTNLVTRPRPGSAARACLRWFVRRPIRMSMTVAMIAWGYRGSLRKLGGSLAAMAMACELAELMSEREVEHVHAHFVGHPATAAWVIRRLVGIPYSVTAHAYELYQDSEFLRPRLRNATFVATISQFNADFLFAHCSGSIPTISVIRAGIDLQDFPFRAREIPSNGPVRALAVGSLIEHKGHSVLIDALGTSYDNGALDRVELTIVGDGPLREALQQQICGLGLSDRVRLVGTKTEDEVSALMQTSDLFVLPSRIAASGRMEGIPVVLMEAMASGLPVIASSLSGIPELVIDGLTGTLIEPGDAAALAAAISSVLADPGRAARIAETARGRVESDFDVKQSAEQLVGRFRSLHATAKARRGGRRAAFVAWSQSARARELASATGASYSVIYPRRLARRHLAPLRYLLSLPQTAMVLVRDRPSVVVATNPPIFPALLVHVLRPLIDTELVLDSHPRGFGYKGSVAGKVMAPVHRHLMRQARATLVAGPRLARVVAASGGRPVVLHEAPPSWELTSPPRIETGGRPSVLWVTIFASDEPVEIVLEAARQLNDIDFLISGDTRRCPPDLLEVAPTNVEFTGFWADEGYARLLKRSDVVLVLTTEPTSVPRAAFEAVEALRPLVVTDLPDLHELFEHAVFVENSVDGVAAGVRSAVDRHDEMVARAYPAREAQRRRWLGQRDQLMELLDVDGAD